VELPIGMSLLWNCNAIKTSVPRLEMDPVHNTLRQLVTKVSQEYMLSAPCMCLYECGDV
jgi:hypothetical protein